MYLEQVKLIKYKIQYKRQDKNVLKQENKIK